MNQLEKYWKILKEKGENNLKKVLYIIFISLTSFGSRMTDAYYPYTLEDTFLGGGSDFLGFGLRVRYMNISIRIS